MASATDFASEPHVLARAKRRLFPGEDENGAYAVVDTQFSTETWLAGHRIDESVRETLAPFNHVRVGGGYPDLVGVRRLESLVGSHWCIEDPTRWLKVPGRRNGLGRPPRRGRESGVSLVVSVRRPAGVGQ